MIMEYNHTNTLGEILHMLAAKGITTQFSIADDGEGLMDSNTDMFYGLFELQLLKSYRFKSNGLKGSSGVVYLMATYKGLMGYVISHSNSGYVSETNKVTILERLKENN